MKPEGTKELKETEGAGTHTGTPQRHGRAVNPGKSGNKLDVWC